MRSAARALRGEPLIISTPLPRRPAAAGKRAFPRKSAFRGGCYHSPARRVVFAFETAGRRREAVHLKNLLSHYQAMWERESSGREPGGEIQAYHS